MATALVRAANGALLKTVYLEFHPRSGEKWDDAVAQVGDAQAIAIQSLFNSTPKGDFAQILADRISAGEPFNTPAYITAAIEALVQ